MDEVGRPHRAMLVTDQLDRNPLGGRASKSIIPAPQMTSPTGSGKVIPTTKQECHFPLEPYSGKKPERESMTRSLFRISLSNGEQHRSSFLESA